MPLLTLLAPGTPVTVPSEGIAAAAVERAEMRAGPDPLWYGLAWQDGGRGPVFRGAFRADRVVEPEPQLGKPAAPAPPRVTVVAPGSACRCPMNLPGARVEAVTVRAGVVKTAPLGRTAPPAVEYHLTWQEPDGPTHRASFRGDQVTEAAGPAGGSALRTNRLRDLGRLMADQLGEPAEGD